MSQVEATNGLSSPANQTRPGPPTLEQVLLAHAPRFDEKVNLIFYIIWCALVVASPLPRLLHVNQGGWFTYLVPWPVLMFSMFLYVRTSDHHEKQYTTLLFRSSGVGESAAARTVAANAWIQRRSTSTAISWAIGLLFFYLTCCYIYLFVTDLNHGHWSAPSIGLHSVLLILSIAQGSMFSVTPLGSTRRQTVKFPGLDDVLSNSDLPLKPSQKNDLVLVRMNVSMQMVMRRAEAYTLESTLLSALSFSAFIGIMFSDHPPKIDISWMKPLGLDCELMLGTPYCSQAIGASISQDHLALIISTCLLLSSVFFLTVLVTRLRFNESYRETDERLKISDHLNKVENDLAKTDESSAAVFTAEIDKLILDVAAGLDGLGPMMSFMKFLRDAGIFFFTCAISICGAYMSWPLALLIMSVFVCVYVAGFAEKLRSNAVAVKYGSAAIRVARAALGQLPQPASLRRES
jgi:hypothetical protein